MSDEQQPWEKQEGEPSIWFQRFTRYRLMSPVRSVAAVFQEEYSKKNQEKPRRNPGPEWYGTSKQWDWEKRAQAWDDYQTDLEEQRIEQEKAEVLKKRYALMHKRVEILDKLVQKLIDETEDDDKIWLPDVKTAGNERVDLVRFNKGLFDEIREMLADIAAETGGRVKKSEASISLPPDLYEGIGPNDDGVEP